MTRRLPSTFGFFWGLATCALLGGCTSEPNASGNSREPDVSNIAPFEQGERELPDSETETANMTSDRGLETATFGAGCYWCTEAVFQRLAGVEGVISGFMGGQVEHPSYEDVCRGITGHAEVIQISYDPKVVGYEELLEVFWKTHDPTTLNKQGADEGTQYRSVVFYHSDQQRELAEKYKKKLDEAHVFDKPIVTEITHASEFYAAKSAHQNFYNSNPYHGYCGYVIRPKLEKLEAVFADKLKKAN